MGFQRRQLVRTIFELLDREGTGRVAVGELKNIFNAERAPEVVRKVRSEEEVMQEFVDTFDLYYNELIVVLRGKITARDRRRRREV